MINLTKQQLSEFDGSNGKTYIACKNTVFDVTNIDKFQAGGIYENYCGKDITMACAHYSTDKRYLNMEWKPDMTLDINQQRNISRFYESFCKNYPKVGTLTPS